MSDLLSHLRVLVVDDEPSIRTAIVAALASEGANVVSVGSSQLALEASRLQPFDVMIVDSRIGKDNGLELLDAIQGADHDCFESSSIVLSDYHPRDILAEDARVAQLDRALVS